VKFRFYCFAVEDIVLDYMHLQISSPYHGPVTVFKYDYA